MRNSPTELSQKVKNDQRIHELEDRLIEMINFEEQREKNWIKMNRASETVGQHQAYMQNGSTKMKGERKGQQNFFQEIMAENSKFEENINLDTSEVQ